MRSADVHSGEDYAVRTRRNDWRGTKPEVLRARVVSKSASGRRIEGAVLEQEVRRNDGRSGTQVLKPFTTTLAPVNILRPWAEEEEARAAALRRQEESIAEMRAEMQAEEDARRARMKTVQDVL